METPRYAWRRLRWRRRRPSCGRSHRPRPGLPAVENLLRAFDDDAFAVLQTLGDLHLSGLRRPRLTSRLATVPSFRTNTKVLPCSGMIEPSGTSSARDDGALIFAVMNMPGRRTPFEIRQLGANADRARDRIDA